MSMDHWAVSAGLVGTSAIALIANALLLLVFFRRRGLRTISNRFVINLLVTNFLSSIIVIPLLLLDQEMQPLGTPSPLEHLVISEGNNSARMEIENLFLENGAPIIRHHEHRLAKLKNASLHEFPATTENTEKNATDDGNNFSTVFLCYLSGGSTGLLSTASILSILLIAIDQYFAVTHPLRYHAFIDKFKSIILLVSTWLISLLFGILGAFVQTDTRVWSFCGVTPDTNEMQNWYNIFYAFTYFTLVILVPFAIICVIYGCIYCAAHRNSERMRKSNSGSSNTNLDVYIQIPLDDCRLKVKVNSSDNVTHLDDENLPKLPKVKSAPNFANLEKTKLNMPVTRLCNSLASEDDKVSHANSLRSNASFINSLRTKISNASLFKYREETRAAKISILVIFMVLVCYVPYGLALVMNTNLIFPSPRYFNSVSLSLLVAANLMSPFLFAYRNRRIQREMRRLFGFLPKRSSRELSVIGSSAFRCSRNRVERSSCMYKPKEIKELAAKEPFLPDNVIPEVVVTCKTDTEKKSILKRVCSKGKTWGTAKRCNFMSVTECLSVECRCSFSSASTQVSSEDYSGCN